MKNRVTVNLNEIDKVKIFVNEISKFESDVDIISGRHICDAKSLMSIFSFDLSNPVDIQIISSNEEEVERFNEVLEEFKVNGI